MSRREGFYERFVKRPQDFLLALIALILLSPVLVVLAVLIRIRLGSPVLFAQERPGLNEKIFTMYKFRTMTNEKDGDGELLPDSLRLTKFGRFLRSTSLDELPELYNVLTGEMSIVGPRPLLIRYLKYYREDEKKRSAVKPGITGLAQISGRNALIWDERFELDLMYMSKISFLLDLKIIFSSILVVFRRKDILIGTEHVIKDLDIDRKEEFFNAFRM